MDPQSLVSRSYYHNPPKTPYVFKTIPDLVNQWAEVHPYKVALVCRLKGVAKEELTFLELNTKSKGFAQGLIKLGLKPGEHVSLNIRNSLEWMIAFCGVLLAGGIAVTATSFHLGTSVKAAEETNCALLIMDTRQTQTMSELRELEEDLQHQIISCGYASKSVILLQSTVKSSRFSDFHNVLNVGLLNENDSSFTFPSLDPDDHCLTFTTSGSTGKPKRILHSHVGIINGFNALADEVGIRSDDVAFSDRAMGYMGGFPWIVFCRGVTAVYGLTQAEPSKEDVGFIFDVWREENITYSVILPYLLYDLLQSEHQQTNPLPKLRIALLGGQVIQKEMLHRMSRFVEKPVGVYGMSEVIGYFVAQSPVQFVDETPGYYPTKGMEVKIVDDYGNVVPLEEQGEICVRCMGSSRTYLKGTTLDVKGWYHTGDMGFLTSSGHIVVSGRVKEMIKRAAVKIHPAMVEKALLAHADVEDVGVVGIPNERLYEDVCASIVTKAGSNLDEETIRSFAHDIFQPSLAPDGFGLMPSQFVFVENIPRTETGKINRKELREICLKLTTKTPTASQLL